MVYSLPIISEEIKNIDKNNSIVDMSKLEFPVNKDLQKRASFLFIRNTSLDLELDFSKCNFKDKEEFLLSYLTGDIDLDIPILTNTWIEILLNEISDEIVLPSIMDKYEINKFTNNNREFIQELYTFIISIPLCSIEFAMDKDDKYITNDFEETDYDKINIANFVRMVDNEDFKLIIGSKDGLTPKYYKKYFHKEDNPYLNDLIKPFPFLDIINIINSDKNTQENFLHHLDASINDAIEGNK